MNKFGMVIGVAAVAVIAGCKDPDYKYGGTQTTSQNDVKLAGGDVAKPADIAVTDAPSAKARHCTCAPGTRHTKPCACGAADCMCVVESKPTIQADLSKPAPVAAPAEPETTVYIVQSGDYLAKISKKFNVTISSIKKLNPSIKENNVVRVGQKIKLPGKIDVGVQKEPAKAAAARPAKKAYAPYAGATKEYVVKSGDTLGAIAYSNGINIRQLKELNGLSKDTLRIGQKLKIPAEKVVAAKPAAKTPAKPAAAKADAKKPAAAAKAA
ncbi:MAG: LysM peptidoglycan-binding domain-containing protein, partial [Kiritimatiellae bacterium]|nr:LysM peptidoglycan-binding domain-containing protein [Kiritimatiellia bacterium]